MKPEKNFYVVQHEYNNGVGTFLVKSDHLPTDKELIEKLALDFEEDNDEYILVFPIAPYEFFEI